MRVIFPARKVDTPSTPHEHNPARKQPHKTRSLVDASRKDACLTNAANARNPSSDAAAAHPATASRTAWLGMSGVLLPATIADDRTMKSNCSYDLNNALNAKYSIASASEYEHRSMAIPAESASLDR